LFSKPFIVRNVDSHAKLLGRNDFFVALVKAVIAQWAPACLTSARHSDFQINRLRDHDAAASRPQ
jgi:hypothetical protein